MNFRDEETNRNSYPSYSRSSPDEVDLGVIAHKIQKGFAYLGRKLWYLVEVVIRRIAIIALAVAVGMGIAYLNYKSTPPKYVSEMILTSTDIRNDYCEDLIEKLNLVIQDGNFPVLARQLRVEESIARSLSNISYAPIGDRKTPEDSILVGQPFVVRVATYNKEAFDSLQAGIHRYLETNEYFMTLKSIRRQRLENLVQKLDKEISQIDSLKMNISFPRGIASSNEIILGQPDPVNMFREGITYFNQKMDASAGLVMIDNFHVISGLSPRQKPNSPILGNYLTTGALLGLLAGLVVGITLDSRRTPKSTKKPIQEQVPV